jgi:type 1 glutamine amidotransferase
MPVAYRKKFGKGKVFVISIGHNPNEFIKSEGALKLFKRGLAWACSN